MANAKKIQAPCKWIAGGLNCLFGASIFSRAFIIRSAARASFVHHARASAEVAVWEKRSASLRRWYNPARVTSIGMAAEVGFEHREEAAELRVGEV